MRLPQIASDMRLPTRRYSADTRIRRASQLPALGREVNGHSLRMSCSLYLAVYIYGSNHTIYISLRLGRLGEPTVTRD